MDAPQYVQCIGSVRGHSSCTGEYCPGPGAGLRDAAKTGRGRSSGKSETIATAGIAKSAAAGCKFPGPADYAATDFAAARSSTTNHAAAGPDASGISGSAFIHASAGDQAAAGAVASAAGQTRT